MPKSTPLPKHWPESPRQDRRLSDLSRITRATGKWQQPGVRPTVHAWMLAATRGLSLAASLKVARAPLACG